MNFRTGFALRDFDCGPFPAPTTAGGFYLDSSLLGLQKARQASGVRVGIWGRHFRSQFRWLKPGFQCMSWVPLVFFGFMTSSSNIVLMMLIVILSIWQGQTCQKFEAKAGWSFLMTRSLKSFFNLFNIFCYGTTSAKSLRSAVHMGNLSVKSIFFSHIRMPVLTRLGRNGILALLGGQGWSTACSSHCMKINLWVAAPKTLVPGYKTLT